MGLLTPLAVKIGGLPWLPRYNAWIVRLDRLVQLLTRGRFTLLSLAGLPELQLTVPGRKSGIERTTPLLCVPHEGGWLIAGSFWGGPKPPAWTYNLEAAGEAGVHFKGRSYRVSARRAVGDERARLWEVMKGTWPNYAKYEARTDREIKVYVLAPLA
ncbi:MAG: nitroreductase family deazaflavin-dependent oxidoreductase [Nocardioides sp.]|nr:nitroreductase family deazaflavin-dependent oxidoreductase [Nocardioides sp.]